MNEERKNFLAQVAELERNSINYFDVEKEFFLIDSDNLPAIQTRFYGYSIQRSGIYEADNLTEEATYNLDGRGCYVYVKVHDGKITIEQDLNGSWGIYLFRHGDYFALSNSFFRLLDHVKFRYPLTINYDYCNYLMVNELCSHAYSETAVNEIRLLERNAILQIDVAKKNLRIGLIDYSEHSIIPASQEGIEILDRWMDFWGDILRGIAKHTNFITADLSGGFDTRLILPILMNSGVDLNEIYIRSLNDDLLTHREDYAISTQIAAHYGFTLNQTLPENRYLNYSLADIFNIDYYCSLTTHNNFLIAIGKILGGATLCRNINKIYHINGFGGETARTYWFNWTKDFLEEQIQNLMEIYPKILAEEVAASTKKILVAGLNAVYRKYKVEDINSPYIPQYLYQETRCRHHFGKTSLNSHFRNVVEISPILDPDFRRISLNPALWQDPNSLMALILTRYNPDLLQFPIEGERTIDSTTLELAQKVNALFPPYKRKFRSGTFNLSPRDFHTEEILSHSRNNENLFGEIPELCLKAAFDSRRIYGLVNTHFNELLYHCAEICYEHTPDKYTRLRFPHAVLGVAKVVEAVEISNCNYPPHRGLGRFLEGEFYQ